MLANVAYYMSTCSTGYSSVESEIGPVEIKKMLIKIMKTASGIHRKILLTGLLCVIGFPVCAQEQSDVHPYLADRFILQGGAFLPKLSLDIGVDGSVTGEHPPIDFEGGVGTTRDDEIFAAEFIWRFGDRWSFRSQHFQGGRNSTKVLEEDFEWEDAVFEQGSFVSGGTDLQITRFFFARDFSKSLQHEFGIGLGLHRMEFGASLTGDIVVNGQQFIGETRAVSAVAPLPNIGTWYAYSPSEKWVFDVRLDWLDASIGDYSGKLINFAAGANYQVLKHVGIGLKYQTFSLKFDIDKTDWHGSLKLAYEGLYFYLSGNWGG